MASSLLKWQLQVMGVWHWAPINRREKCILCQDRPGPDAHDDALSDAHTGHFAQENGFNNNNNSGYLHGGFYGDENLSGDAHEIATASRNNRRGDQGHEVENDFEASCTVCKSLLWNGEGQAIHDIKELVPNRWSRGIGTISSLVFMLLVMSGMLYNTFLYIRYLFGHVDEVMHLTSFLSFSIGLYSVPVICVYAKLRYFAGGYGHEVDPDYGQKHRGWCGVLHQDYMARRFQYMHGSDGFQVPSRAYLAACVIWPCINMGLEIFYLFVLLANDSEMNDHFAWTEVAAVTVGMLLYGMFCHIIFLIRVSFEYECNLLVTYISRNTGHLDRCRARLADTYRDYRVFQSAVKYWMAFIIALGVLGLSVHISWNYNVYSGQEATEESAEELISLNVLIFSEKFMSLVLPVVAVGGMDLCYLWRQFHYTLSRHRSSDREFFWERLSTYVHELDWNDGSSGFTMFLSVISLYTGLRLSQQNLDYNIPGGS